MVKIFLDLSEYVVYFSALLALLSICCYGRYGAQLKAFCIFILVSGAFDVLAFSFSQLQLNNLPLMHLYTFLELTIWSGFFISVFHKMKVRYPVKAITVVVLAFCIFNSLFIQQLDNVNSNAATLVSLTIIGFCVLTFYHLIDRDIEKYKYVKWIVSGLLIYQTMSFIVLAFGKTLNEFLLEDAMIIWGIRIFIILIAKMIFGYVLIHAAYYRSKIK